MSNPLTPSQRKALSRERHLAVVANAGSGKTQVLVARYLDILLRNPLVGPRNVAAITFTENAAAELRERIAREIDERLSDPAHSEDRSRLRQIRNGFQSAVITTIHGFASKVLRAYPVEARIDAQYSVLSGPDLDVLREDCIARVFYTILEDAYAASEQSELLRAFRSLGRLGMTKAVRALLNNRMRAERLLGSLYEHADDEVLRAWFEAVKSELAWIESDATMAALALLEPWYTANSYGKKAQSAVSQFCGSATRDRIDAFGLVRSTVFTKDGALQKRPFAKEMDLDVAAALQPLCLQLKQSAKLLNLLSDGEEAFMESHREYLALTRSVFEVYRQVLTDYENVKSDYAQLDFDDLLILLERLLTNQRIREELAALYPHVLIDEYQDTDETQYEIARLLSLNFGASTRLMVVGDPKQSIYRFRNADVEVFAETCEAIRDQVLSDAAPPDAREFDLTGVEVRGLLALRESFRMATAPLAFINTLLATAMQDASIPYLDLVSAYTGSHEGSVTFMLDTGVATEEDEEPQEAVGSEEEPGRYERECAYIAQKIQELVGSVSIEDKDREHGATFRDIAILLRTRSRLTDLESALQRQHIPYIVAKGTGFFLQQEVMDVISYLRFLVNPSDDIALAGILRSPFFGVSDQELFQISHAARLERLTTSFWDQVLMFPAARRSPALERAIDQLGAMLPLVGRTSSALLVERIYAVSGIVAVLGCSDNGEQKIANIEKLLDMARESDRSGFSTLFDFVERLTYLQERNEGEAQADITSGGDAVRIMTVHAAKGLEFPIVFVPFLGAATQQDSGAYLDKHLGLRLPGRSDDLPAIAALMDSHNSRAETAESLRLLYVALTRAKEHLYLTATKPSKRNRSWLTQMLTALPILEQPEDVRLPSAIERYSVTTKDVSEIAYNLLIHREEPGTENAAPAHVEKAVLPDVTQFYLDAIPIPNPVGSYSATQLLTLRECQTKYYLRYILGIPEEPRLENDLEPHEASERIRGPLLGQFVHALLERVSAYASAGLFDENAFEHTARRIGERLHLRSEDEFDDLTRFERQHVTNFLQSNLANYVFGSNETNTEFELELVLATGDRIFGILDRTLRLPDGRLAVVDYKTDRLRPETLKAKLSRYRFQLLLYAYLLSRYSGEESIVGSLFFTMPKAGGQSEHFSYDFTRADFDDLEAQLAEHLSVIRKMEAITDIADLEQNESHCADCTYFSSSQNRCMAATDEPVVQKPIAIPAM